jgi:hypothetical protein
MKKPFVLMLCVALVAAATGAGVYVAYERHARAQRIGNDPPPGGRDAVVGAENDKPGSRSWLLTAKHRQGGVEGFAARTSVAAGERLGVFVRTRARTFRANVFRMGWYHGKGARRYAALGPFGGDAQQPCGERDARHLVACDWNVSFTVRTGRAWVSGMYVAKLVASDGTQSYVPFTVRERAPRAPIVVQSSVTTWQAYNGWGGRSLYGGPCFHRVYPPRAPEPKVTLSPTPAPTKVKPPKPSPSPSATSILPAARSSGVAPRGRSASRDAGAHAAPVPARTPGGGGSSSPGRRAVSRIVQEGEGCFDTRASAVSFDRPYQWPGAGRFFRFEFSLVRFLEQRGYGVAYATDVDLERGRDALGSRKVFISSGHDEYWSPRMRANVERALKDGTSLAFFGGNDMYRRIRFEDSAVGPDRVQVHYRYPSADPVAGAPTTGQWREAPARKPEQSLLGAQYSCNPVRADWVATGEPGWLFARTGLGDGDRVAGLVGYEYDRHFAGVAAPDGVKMVSRSFVRCRGVPDEQNTTFYVAASGAAVFDAGTIWWNCALAAGCSGHRADARVGALTNNLLRAMLTRKFA